MILDIDHGGNANRWPLDLEQADPSGTRRSSLVEADRHRAVIALRTLLLTGG
jgi:hypothetical protein